MAKWRGRRGVIEVVAIEERKGMSQGRGGGCGDKGGEEWRWQWWWRGRGRVLRWLLRMKRRGGGVECGWRVAMVEDREGRRSQGGKGGPEG